MDFEQAEKRFRQLKAQFEAGNLSESEFKDQLQELMIQDERGAWWMIGYETERWYRHDGTNWMQADPPGNPGPAQEAVLREREAMERAALGEIDRKVAEGTVREEAKQKVAETPITITKQHREKSLSIQGFLFSWQWRMLLGGAVGLIPGFMTDSLVGVIVLPIACGLAGLITYPHKLSILFLLLGFFVAGFISSPDFSYPEDFFGFGALFGIPAGALLSRILGWAKVLK